MSHKYNSLFYYVTWNTADHNLILQANSSQLSPYLKKIASDFKLETRAFGTTKDSVHMVLKISARHTLSDIVRTLKSNSSKLIKQRWEPEYRAFTLHHSQVSALKQYFRANKLHAIHAPEIDLCFHITWSTKKRLPLISPHIEQELYSYIKNTAYQYNIDTIAIGGIQDHIHLLIKTSGNHSLSNFICTAKSSAAVFINKHPKNNCHIVWQQGYAAFTIHSSRIRIVQNYIRNQHKHHKTFEYKEELKQFFGYN